MEFIIKLQSVVVQPISGTLMKPISSDYALNLQQKESSDPKLMISIHYYWFFFISIVFIIHAFIPQKGFERQILTYLWN